MSDTPVTPLAELTGPQTVAGEAANRELGGDSDISFVSLNRWDFLLLASGIASVLSYCILISPKKLFWADEITTWVIITDPSASHMVNAVAHAVDGALPCYFLLARVWALFFGATELPLRLFASIGFCIALAVTWVTVRRCYSLLPTAFGLLTVWCMSSLMLLQSTEARNYGLLVATFAIAVGNFCVLVERRELSRRLLIAIFFTHAILVWSHLYGILYGGAILAALIVWDLSRRQLRLKAYAAMIAGWLTLTPYARAIARILALGKPHGWRVAPDFPELLDAYSFGIPLWPVAVLAAIIAAGVFLSHKDVCREQTSRSSAVSGQGALLLLGVAVMAIPLLCFVLAQWSTTLFNQRYFLPASIGLGFLLTHLVETNTAMWGLKGAWARAMTVCCALLLGCMMVLPVVTALHASPAEASGFRYVDTLIPPGMPVILEDMHMFLSLSYFTGRRDRPYFYVLDWPLASQARSPQSAALCHNTMRAWKQNGYWSDRIIDSQELLCRGQRFMVIDSPDTLPWYQAHVAGNPAFNSRLVQYLDQRHALVVVERRPAVEVEGCINQ